jgi:hypothetical protein
MENANTFFNSWLENQNKVMQNWYETSKKFQETVAQAGNAEKSSDLYKEWIENQKNVFNQFVATSAIANGNGKFQANNADLLKQWQDMQSDFMKQWGEYAEKYTGRSLPSSPEDFLKETRKVYDKWNEVYTNWYSTFGKSFEEFRKNIPVNLGKDVFTNIFDTNKTYLKMQEFYAPVYQLMKDGKLDHETIRKAVDPARYREVVETMFEFLSPDKAREMYTQMNKYIQMFYEMGRKTTDQYKAQLEQMQTNIPSFFKIEPNSVAEMSLEFSRQFEKYYSPFHKMMPPSKEKEMLEEALALQEKYAQYWSKSSQMQQFILKNAELALTEALDAVVKEATAGKEVEFAKFFPKWVGILEEKMIKSFSTDEFSKTQGDMLSLGLDIKKSISSQMEFALSPYPVVPKSEFDELLETVHELKRKVRALEKQLGDTSAEAEDKTAKKVVSKVKA